MIIDFIIEDLMLNSYLQKNFHTLSSAFSLRPVVKLTVNKRLTNTNIRHINPDMTDTYKFILDISLVYLTRG